MFKRTILTVASIAALVIPIAACDPIDESKGTVTASNTPVVEEADITTNVIPKTTTEEKVDIDQVFLAAMRQKGLPATQQAIDTAHAMCDALDAGNSVESVINLSLESLGEDGPFFVGAGVGAYCPEYGDDIDDLAGN